MRLAALVERLIVKSATTTSDGQGGTIATPVTVTSIPAELIPRNVSEVLQAESVASHAQYQFRIRARGGLSAGMTLSWTPRWPTGATALTLQILGLLPEAQRGSMVLTCAAVQ